MNKAETYIRERIEEIENYLGTGVREGTHALELSRELDDLYEALYNDSSLRQNL